MNSLQKEIDCLKQDKLYIEERLSLVNQEGAILFLKHLLDYCQEKLHELLEIQNNTY